jgi:ribonuclease HI
MKSPPSLCQESHHAGSFNFPPQDFKNWLNCPKESCSLCFDGASKGNPGEAGAGGVLFIPRGQRLLTYSWNLGITTNNLAEAYAIFKGAQLAQERQINQLIILGDSKNIIRYFIKKQPRRIQI